MTRLFGALVVLLLLATSLLSALPPASAAAHIPVGADIIVGPAFDSHHRVLFRRMRGEIIRFRIPAGFGGTPAQVEKLIADGARTVIFTTQDEDFTPQRVRADLVGRGFYAVVQRHPEVQFFLEVSNETNIAGLDPWVARFWMIRTRQELRDLDRPNFKWMASMPTVARDTEIILSRQSDGAVGDVYDAIAVHHYGDFNVWPLEDHYEWGRVMHLVMTQTTLPIYVTEIGINDAATPKAEKARRILAAVSQMPSRVKGVTVFWITEPSDRRWSQYTVDGAMADALAARWGTPCRYFPETNQVLADVFLTFWNQSGGLPVFGYPLSPRLGAVQWTERQRFESHPENAPPYHVLLGLLGRDDATTRGLWSHPAFTPRPGQSAGPHRYFPETGHHLSYGFRAYWETHGLEMGDPGVSFRESLALFGYPISEEFVDARTGRVTQYFERAVFEYHPENPEPYTVLLRRLGAEQCP